MELVIELRTHTVSFFKKNNINSQVIQCFNIFNASILIKIKLIKQIATDCL